MEQNQQQNPFLDFGYHLWLDQDKLVQFGDTQKKLDQHWIYMKTLQELEKRTGEEGSRKPMTYTLKKRHPERSGKLWPNISP